MLPSIDSYPHICPWPVRPDEIRAQARKQNLIRTARPAVFAEVRGKSCRLGHSILARER
jgi:hypothetical protein